MDLTGDVRKVLAEELNLEAIEAGARQEDYPEWDSLTYLRIVAALEDTFKIQITSENINKLNSVESIVNEIKKCRNHR